MEESIVKVLVLILRQLPSGCILHITDYIENAFSDGQLLPLKQFHIEKESEKYSFDLSERCISYLIEELPNYNWVSYLVNYIKNHPQSTSGLSITEYDFAPFEPTMQKAVLGVDTYQYSHKHDRVAGSKKIEGAHYMKTSESIKDGHSISSFWQYIYNLPEGHYIFENGIPNNDN